MQALRPLYRYFEFSGRSTRAEYWQWTALVTMVGWLVSALQSTVPGGEAMSLLYMAATFIPQTAAAFRRLHDIGRSGWIFGILWAITAIVVPLLYFAVFILQATGANDLMFPAVIGGIIWLAWGIFVIIQLAKPGDPNANRFGPPDPGAAARPDGSALPLPRPFYAPASSSVRQIEDLARLHAQGALSDDEFAAAKARLLNTLDEPAQSDGSARFR